MPLIQLQSAQLDSLSSSSSSSSEESASAMSSFLDQIKMSASSFGNRSAELIFQKKSSSSSSSLDPKKKQKHLNFTAITESLSASSEDISDALGRTFGIFGSATGTPIIRSPTTCARRRTGNASNKEDFVQVGERIKPGYHKSYHRDNLVSASNLPFQQDTKAYTKRANRILTHLAKSKSSTSIYTDEEDWDDDTANGSREQSLLDVYGDDEEEEQVTGEIADAEFEDRDEQESLGSMHSYDSRQEDDEYSNDDSYDEEEDYEAEMYREGLSQISGVLMSIGSCSFRNSKQDENDDDSAVSYIDENQIERGRSRSPRTPPGNNNKKNEKTHGKEPPAHYRRKTAEPNPGRMTLEQNQQQEQSFLSALFRCGGAL